MTALRRMVARRTFLQGLGAKTCTAVAAWGAGGALMLTSVEDRSVRLDVLPPPSWLVVGLVAAVVRALCIDALLCGSRSACASWGTGGQG
jgi:hypothetical protein